MPESSDRTYLRTEQYRDAGNLTARIQLHERFSTNQYGWHRWVFDQFELSPQARILELGCGSGRLWAENQERLPVRWEVILSDFSPGMVEEARQTVHAAPRLDFLVGDAEAIPFPEETFDAVVANFMLHHVPDRGKALSEIHRVLRSGGRVFAATNGQAHMRELGDLLRQVDPEAPRWKPSEGFTLENGPPQMEHWFADLSVRRYDDALLVTEAEPLIAYVLSGRTQTWLVGERRYRFAHQIKAALARRGAIRITKDAGMIIGVGASGHPGTSSS